MLRWYHRLKIIADSLVYKPIKTRKTEIACFVVSRSLSINLSANPAYAAVFRNGGGCAGILNRSWAKGLINQALHQFLNQPEKFLAKADATEVGPILPIRLV